MTAQQVTGPTGVDPQLHGDVAVQRRRAAHFYCAFHVADRSYLEVVGTEGRVQVSATLGTAPNPRSPSRCAAPSQYAPRSQPANPYKLELEEFDKAVRGEPNQLIGRADAEGQANAVEALVIRAADSETTVRIG